MQDAIPFDELKIGGIYRLRARNLTIGVWRGDSFVGIREKFGERFLDGCEVPGHTAWAIAQIGTVPDDIPLTESLGSQCGVCGRAVRWSGPPAPAPWVHIEDGSATDHPESVANRRLFAHLTRLEHTTKG